MRYYIEVIFMDFSSLVLVERDKETNNIIKELGSYQVSEGAEYITKLFYDGECINLFFDTERDVEEWEYTAIFDLFDISEFEEKGFEISDVDDEYNPTWLVRLDYDEDHNVVKEKLSIICELIKKSLDKVFNEIEEKKEEYK